MPLARNSQRGRTRLRSARASGGGLLSRTAKRVLSSTHSQWKESSNDHWRVFWQERSHDTILTLVTNKANELEEDSTRMVERIVINTYRRGMRESARTIAWIFTTPKHPHSPSGPITFKSTKLSVDNENANLSTLRDLQNYANHLGGVQLDSYSSYGRRLAERVTLGVQFLSDSRRAFVFYRDGNSS